MSEQLQQQLQQHFADSLLSCNEYLQQVTIEIAADDLISIATRLRDEPEFAFEQLSDLCAVDYSAYGSADWDTQSTSQTGFSRAVDKGVKQAEQPEQKLAVVYHLLSLKHNQRLRVRCYLSQQPPIIASVNHIWPAANWYEREAFDLFGILFEGHPDLRRILTDYGFIGHPFRKDFPLEGNVEVRYDPDQQRVVYEPVSIENRVLVPKVIREDNRYLEEGES